MDLDSSCVSLEKAFNFSESQKLQLQKEGISELHIVMIKWDNECAEFGRVPDTEVVQQLIVKWYVGVSLYQLVSWMLNFQGLYEPIVKKNYY